MLDTLITSKTRIKLLLKFFLNANNKAHLRGLANELGESSNAVRLELNRLQDAGMIHATSQGNKKLYQVNTTHPLYNEINSIVFKFIGLDVLVERIITKLGSLNAVYLSGDLANGIDSPIIDLIFVGETINTSYLAQLVDKAEHYVNRKIRYINYSPQDWIVIENRMHPLVLLWSGN